MKIRYKITLWVAGVGLLTSMFFSLVCFFEMREQPYRLLNAELEAAGDSLRLLFGKDETPDASKLAEFDALFGKRYWIEISDAKGRLLFRSAVAGRIKFPARSEGNDETLLLDRSTVERELVGNIPFLVKRVNFGPYQVRIGAPIEKLEEEISELIFTLTLGFVVSSLLLFLLSYYAAGRILRPITLINRLVRHISDKTLDRRIPLGASRDELHELAISLNHMFDRLQYSFATQKQFLANASHELKSPTAMLRLFFDEAKQRTDLPESLRKQLIVQGDIVLRMERLIKMLLELSVMEMQDSLDAEEFDLAALSRDVLEAFAPLLASNDIRLEQELEERLVLSGDKGRIRRLLINVVDNAIKYNREGGEIRFALSAKDDAAHLVLMNTGAGIPPDELEKVFEQFYRVEKSRSQQYGGSGLGLTICREIVRLHGGTIAFENGPPGWMKLKILLPGIRTR